MGEDRELVYSSETGWQNTPPRRPKGTAAKATLPDDGIIRIARERRRGSTMTLVHGLTLDELPGIGKTLKRLCGTGGTTKNDILEIQGDHREKIAAWFAAQGRKTKLAGG